MPAPVIEIAPKDIIHPDVVGLYPLPYAANPENTGDRLQAIANELGITLVATDLFEQKHTTIFDMKARVALRPGPNFADTCKRQGERVLGLVGEYEQRVGIGHSLGGVMITGMQRYSEVAPFTCVELCDAFNLNERGYPGFLAYQVRDAISRIRNSSSEPAEENPPHDWSEHSEDDETSIIAKTRNVAGIMKSTEGKAGALALAANAQLPLHVIGYTHGLAGPKKYLAAFFKELRATRDSGAESSANPAELLITEENRWHSGLLRSANVAANLQKTLGLLGLSAS